MKNKIIYFLAFTSLLVFNCCTKCPACEPPPLEVGMRIVDLNTNEDLIYNKNYNLDSIQIYYLDNSNKRYLEIWSTVDTTNHQVLIVPFGWCQKSLVGIKDFYMYFNRNDLDTIRLDVFETEDKCCSVSKLKQFEINRVQLDINVSNWSRVFMK